MGDLQVPCLIFQGEIILAKLLQFPNHWKTLHKFYDSLNIFLQSFIKKTQTPKIPQQNLKKTNFSPNRYTDSIKTVKKNQALKRQHPTENQRVTVPTNVEGPTKAHTIHENWYIYLHVPHKKLKNPPSMDR